MNSTMERVNISRELKIDEVDVKILKTLLQEPRTSFSNIAKECGLSIPSICHRFDLLKSSGIINGSVMQIDPKSVGYDCVAMVNIQANPKDKKTILNFLQTQNIPFYDHYLTGSGLLSFIVAKNMDELARVSNKMKGHPTIREISSVIWVNTTNIDHPENLVIPKISVSFCPNERNVTKENVKNDLYSLKLPISSRQNEKNSLFANLDAIDLSLVRLLTNNARTSFRKLSEILGISTNNVINRYKKLRKSVLLSSSITVNLEKLGYIGSGVMKIKVADGFFVQEIFDKIVQIPNVIIGIQIFGDYDILVISPFRAFNELEKLSQKISSISGVYDIELLVDKPFTKWPLNIISDTILTNSVVKSTEATSV